MLRNILFWTTDKLTGSKKKANRNDIKFIITNSISEKAKKKKKKYLDTILQHVIETVPHYKNEKLKIDSFPIVNKNIIRANFIDFQSVIYTDKKKKTVSTSGSTGTPFMVYHDKNKSTRNTADNLYFWGEAGYKIGDKLYFFRLWNAFEKKNFLTHFAQNVVPIDVFDLTDSFIDDLLDTLQKRKRKSCLLGYVSAFEKICKHLDRKNPNFRITSVKSIIAISEKLNQYTKDSVKKYFGIEPVSRYSNIENGIIAQQLKGKSHFIINDASYYVEILDINTNEPAKKGVIGRIVITDLFNYCTPMIRYDTGDLGAFDIIDEKKVLTKIEGRKIDSIKNTKGEIISFNLVLMVNKYPQLTQCQLVQKSKKDYILKLNSNNIFSKEEELLSDFKRYLGKDANITIEYVSEIPLLASGKRRVMVNEMV
ncbi:CoF synthetase [uncultured Aquimarina sp.]|uniref:CoF synthetase n=1 Tax=uncultured Aquimarina sp. TaxID=575652 RepID=UPI002628A3DC|nr:CoF synthetase [uncultured Aquimarina sp.]